MTELRIIEGRYYRTRDGRKVGPMKPHNPGDWFFIEVDGDGRGWRPDGEGVWDAHKESIVSEWIDTQSSPVQTKTVKEIVPGSYGQTKVGEVSDDNKAIWVEVLDYLSAQELREAARIFTDLAEYLEGGE